MKQLLSTISLTIAVLLGGAGEGWSKEPSPTKNMKKFIIAAENGDKNAAFTLGGIYSGTLGGGDFTDHRMAAKYWRVAAEQGDSRAIEMLNEYKNK